MSYYSPYKAAFHKEKIEQLRKGEMITPIFAQIDLTNACNLNCNFCSYRVGNYSSEHIRDFRPADKLDKDLVFKLLYDMFQVQVRAIEWTGGGEPTLHRDWKEIIESAKDLGYEQALVTNGTVLEVEDIKDFEWVRFSLDASNEETYQKIKGRKGLNLALGNLEKLVRIKDPKNIIGASFIVCRDNYQEIYEATKTAKNLGADNIRFSLAYTPEGDKMFAGIWEEIVREIEKSRQEETDSFKVFAFSNRINEISQKTRSPSCYFHEFVAAIGANNSLYPCCLLKYDPRFNFGNLEEKSFEEIWFGPERVKFTQQIRKGCNYSCWMTDKNSFISFLVQNDAKHVNFI